MNWFRKWWGNEREVSFWEVRELPDHPHWSAKVIRYCAKFCFREWKWLATVAIAIIGLLFKIQ
jgi:hypothetical protein